MSPELKATANESAVNACIASMAAFIITVIHWLMLSKWPSADDLVHIWWLSFAGASVGTIYNLHKRVTHLRRMFDQAIKGPYYHEG